MRSRLGLLRIFSQIKNVMKKLINNIVLGNSVKGEKINVVIGSPKVMKTTLPSQNISFNEWNTHINKLLSVR